jgi:HTH-type transcriptional regulator, sugar sensing transcriptional regulator
MFKHIFQKADLTPTQAAILEYLYQKKEAKASEISKIIKRSRAIVYKDLEELINFKIVERFDKQGQVSVFRANHPAHLEKMIDQKEEQIKRDRQLFKSYLPDLISNYNLANNRPGIKFFEGGEGIKAVLWDTLNAKEEICTITDPKAIRKNQELKKINEEYVEERKNLKIKKRLIVPLSERDFFPKSKTEFTEVRFIDQKKEDFCTAIQIYNNKISYQTITEDNAIGVIIEDKNIYQMHKMIFEGLWNNSRM